MQHGKRGDVARITHRNVIEKVVKVATWHEGIHEIGTDVFPGNVHLLIIRWALFIFDMSPGKHERQRHQRPHQPNECCCYCFLLMALD